MSSYQTIRQALETHCPECCGHTESKTAADCEELAPAFEALASLHAENERLREELRGRPLPQPGRGDDHLYGTQRKKETDRCRIHDRMRCQPGVGTSSDGRHCGLHARTPCDFTNVEEESDG